MFNQIFASLLDKLKVKNPTLFLWVTTILILLYTGLDYVSGQTDLPNWLVVVVPYLKGVLVALGFGLNSSTKQFRSSILPLLLLFFSFSAFSQSDRLQRQANHAKLETKYYKQFQVKQRLQFDLQDIKRNFNAAKNKHIAAGIALDNQGNTNGLGALGKWYDPCVVYSDYYAFSDDCDDYSTYIDGCGKGSGWCFVINTTTTGKEYWTLQKDNVRVIQSDNLAVLPSIERFVLLFKNDESMIEDDGSTFMVKNPDEDLLSSGLIATTTKPISNVLSPLGGTHNYLVQKGNQKLEFVQNSNTAPFQPGTFTAKPTVGKIVDGHWILGGIGF
jgi:hypothetical protein